jgi:hypothetical protein
MRKEERRKSGLHSMRAATMLKKKPFTPFLQGEGVHQKKGGSIYPLLDRTKRAERTKTVGNLKLRQSA